MAYFNDPDYKEYLEKLRKELMHSYKLMEADPSSTSRDKIDLLSKIKVVSSPSSLERHGTKLLEQEAVLNTSTIELREILKNVLEDNEVKFKPTNNEDILDVELAIDHAQGEGLDYYKFDLTQEEMFKELDDNSDLSSSLTVVERK